jgi:PKD repeat protein
LINTNLNGSDTLHLENHINVIDAPEIEIAAQVNGRSVSLSATSSDRASYFWNLGDGNTAFGGVVNYTYATDGSYTVVLTAETQCGAQVIEETIVIEPVDVQLPEASFEQTNTFVNTAGRILFNSTSSLTTRVEWFFEDGSPATSTSNQVIVQYDSPGSFDVMLIAYNEDGSDTLVQEDFIVVEEQSSGFSESETRNFARAEDDAAITISAYPNPFSDQVSIAFSSAVRQNVEFRITDLNGRFIDAQTFQASKGMNNWTIRTTDFASGMYIISVKLRDTLLQQKIIKR